MSEDEKYLIAVIVSILLGTNDEPMVEHDLKIATARAGFTPEYLLSVARSLEAHE